MRKQGTRIWSMILAVVMLLTMMPVSALAVDTEAMGILNLDPTVAPDVKNTEVQIWDSSIAEGFAGGTGTETNPYQISNGEQLAYLSSLCQHGNQTWGYYILTDDIYLNKNYENYTSWHEVPPENSWTPIGVFEGIFDGSGHTIYGMYINSSEDNIGLFSELTGSTIQNLSISDSYIKGNNNVGAICGYSTWNSQVINCSNSGIVQGVTGVGGIVGSTYVSSLDCQYCYNTGSISGESQVGGILGLHAGGENGKNTILASCYNTGVIYANQQAGGIAGCIGNVGVGNSYVNNCYNTGSVTCVTNMAGGIVGFLHPYRIVNYCYNTGEIKGAENETYVGAIIGRREVFSGVYNCYYWDESCIRGSCSSWSGEELLSPLSEAQMKIATNYSGFDFSNVWYMDSQYPQLIFPDTRFYAITRVVDSSTNATLTDFSVTIDETSNIEYAMLDGLIYFLGLSEDFDSSASIRISKGGYEDFLIQSNELITTCSLAHIQENIVYLVSTSAEPSEDEESNLYILEHTNFAQNNYDNMVKSYGFQNAYWQFEDGEYLGTADLGSLAGDLSDLFSLNLNLGEYEIFTNYYTIYISDLIILMSDTEQSILADESALEAYHKIYSQTVDNSVLKLMSLDSQKDDLFSPAEREAWDSIVSDIQYASTDTGLVGWDAVGYDIDMLIKGNGEYQINSATENLINWIFGPEFVDRHDYIVNSLFEGFSIVDEVCGYITNAKDCISGFQEATQAYITAATCADISTKLFDVLTKASETMKGQDADDFKTALDNYRGIVLDTNQLYQQCLQELAAGVVQFTYDSFIKGYVTKFAYTNVAKVLGCPVSAIQGAVYLYNIGYSILNAVMGVDDKSKQYHIMYYISPIEAALETVVKEYGNELISDQVYEKAEIYDYAYRTLAATNKYLYSSLYALGASGAAIEIGNMHIGQLPELMELATVPLHNWATRQCHGTAVSLTNHYKYTSIQCPVDVYVYNSQGDILVSIINEEVVDYDPSITVLLYNEKKTLIYPADENYSIEIVSRTNGLMDYYVAELGNGEKRNIDFYNIPLSIGQRYTGSIPAEFDIDSSSYALHTNNGSVNNNYDTDSSIACLSTPTDVHWEGSVATWASVENAMGYKLYLFRDGEPVSETKVLGETYDLGPNMTGTGDYCFAVVAVGDNTNNTDSRRSEFSPTYSVNAIGVENVELNITNCEVEEGKSFTLIPMIYPNDAGNKEVVWRSDNNEVATVSEDGVVIAVSSGIAYITVTTVDGGHTAVCTVVVKPTSDSPEADVGEPSNTGGGDGGSPSTGNTPSASVSGTGGNVSASDNGTVTITPDEGYQIGSITVNGEQVSIPSNGVLTGLDSDDKVVVTFEQITDNTGLPFVDVATASWYADAVQYVYENGMMNGTSETQFSPDSTTTRAMIVTILHRLEGEPAADASSFTDVVAGSYYADAVNWAAANGIVTGISETSFAPDDPITREQMAAILYRYAQYKGYDVTASTDLSAYTDAAQISSYAAAAMQWANAEGLITGNTATTINPAGNATRAEVATILMRFCENIIE